MSAPRTRRWFVWNGRYTSEPCLKTMLFRERKQDEKESGPSKLTVQLDTSQDVSLDNRIGVRIVSAQTFAPKRLRRQLLHGRGQYLAVELVLKRAEKIDGLLILIHRIPNKEETQKEELLVYRQLFSKKDIDSAVEADIGEYFNRDGKKQKRGIKIDDADKRIGRGAGVLYRVSAWVAHNAKALELPPKKIALPKEAQDPPMCVSDRSAKKKQKSELPEPAPGRDLGYVDSAAALWKTLR